MSPAWVPEVGYAASVTPGQPPKAYALSSEPFTAADN
jgi:hypothetical protein